MYIRYRFRTYVLYVLLFPCLVTPCSLDVFSIPLLQVVVLSVGSKAVGGHDFKLLRRGDPVFEDLESGDTIPWEGPDCYPAFVNEARDVFRALQRVERAWVNCYDFVWEFRWTLCKFLLRLCEL